MALSTTSRTSNTSRISTTSNMLRSSDSSRTPIVFTTTHPFFKFLRYIWDQDQKFFVESFSSDDLSLQAKAYNHLRNTLAELTSIPAESPFPYPGNVNLSPNRLPYTPFSFLYPISTNPLSASPIVELQVKIRFEPLKQEDSYLILPHVPNLQLQTTKKSDVDLLLLNILSLEIRSRNLYLLHSHFKASMFKWKQDSKHPDALTNNPVLIGTINKIPNIIISVLPKSNLIKIEAITPSTTLPTQSRVWHQPTERPLTSLTMVKQKNRAIALTNYLKGMWFKRGIVPLTSE